jgi:signal recognition particle subunit SRP54
MFETLTNRLQNVFDSLGQRGRLSEADVEAAFRELRVALLEADVHFKVVKTLLGRVKTRAVGIEISKALNPGQQIVKILHEELLQTLGNAERLNLSGQPPRVILLVGLQGAGKTTLAGKLALRLKKQGNKPLLVAADPYRPAAAEQLKTLGRNVDVPVFHGPEAPPQLAANAVKYAASIGRDVVIVDTAGRLQIDENMMQEVASVKRLTNPQEVLLVADSMTGQEAVRIAEGFHAKVGLTGLVLTKVDGDSRGGAAISMREVTGVPIKFLGTSEKLDGLEVFTPERLANRILGMGDVIGLIEKAEEVYDIKQAEDLERKLRKSEFDLEDFLTQMRQIKKMGPIGQLLEMVPGMRGMTQQINNEDTERKLKRTEAMISSMTRQERRNPKLMNASRKRRVASGSGTTVQEVNQLLKQFRDMQDLIKQANQGKGGMRGLMGRFGL